MAKNLKTEDSLRNKLTVAFVPPDKEARAKLLDILKGVFRSDEELISEIASSPTAIRELWMIYQRELSDRPENADLILRTRLFFEHKHRPAIWDEAYELDGQDREKLVDEEATIAEVTMLDFTTDESRPYAVDTRKETAIPATQKKALIQPSNDKVVNRLIYSRSLLTEKAQADIDELEQHGVTLIDLDAIDESLLCDNSMQLLAIASQELKTFGSGGNPAAASDLIRWIPELMEDGVYADIDMPLTGHKTRDAAIQMVGVPVLINMGSIISELIPPHGRRQEAISLNTDIIAYSRDDAMPQFCEEMGRKLIEFCTTPKAALAALDKPLSRYDGLLNLPAEASVKDIRISLEALTADIPTAFEYLGFEEASRQFEINEEQYERLIYLSPSAAAEYLDGIDIEDAREKLTALHGDAYYLTVVEIAGPGAVYSALDGSTTFNSIKRETLLPTSEARAIEQYASPVGITRFESDNIPLWRTPQTVHALQVYNQDGGTWQPGGLGLR